MSRSRPSGGRWIPAACGNCCASSTGRARRSAPRLTIADHAAATYLADAKKAQELGPRAWLEFAALLKGDLAPEARTQWAGGIRAAFGATQEQLFAMKPADVRPLLECLGDLDAKTAGQLALTFISDDQKRPTLSPEDLADLARVAAEGDAAAVAPLMDNIEQAWLAADRKAPMSLDQMHRIWQCLRQTGNPAKINDWLMRAYGTRFGTEDKWKGVDPGTLWWFAEHMGESAMGGKGQGYPAFAAATARRIREGASFWPYQLPLMSSLLGTPESRQLLQDELIDDQGNPRLAAAKILAWAYRGAGQLKDWRKLVDDKIAAGQGDSKALWLAVKAYSDTLVTQPPNPLARKPGLDQALAAAASDPVKMAVLGELVELYKEAKREAAAVDLLDSVKSQVGGDTAKAIEGLQAQLRRDDAEHKAADARVQASRTVLQKEAQLQMLKKSLKQAQTAGDTGAADKLQAAVSNLEKDLN